MKKALLFVVLVGIFTLTFLPLDASPIPPEAVKLAPASADPTEPSSCTVGSPSELAHVSDLRSQSLDYCGACSDSQCQGAQRGQLCWLPGVEGGWGFCNVNTWAQWCTQWEWECVCRAGSIE
jgi:hypothetical protein